MLAEGGDAAALARSVPLTDEVLSEAMVCYGQNGEALRPEQGYPLRLLLPGFESNINVKWLRRLKLRATPFMTRWETAKYTDLMPDGKAYQFSIEPKVDGPKGAFSKSVPRNVTRESKEVGELQGSTNKKLLPDRSSRSYQSRRASRTVLGELHHQYKMFKSP